MKNLVKFFTELGQLRKVKRRGALLIGAKDPASVADHSFRTAFIVWILASSKKNNLNAERALKIALIHDICELYAGDMTPYDFYSFLPKDKKKWPETFDKWPRFTNLKKTKSVAQKHKKEKQSLLKLISFLPPKLKKEIFDLWLDYEKGLTKEGRFVKQANRTETLLEALEYGKESKKPLYKSWWVGTEEMVDDPALLDFIQEMTKKFHKK